MESVTTAVLDSTREAEERNAKWRELLTPDGRVSGLAIGRTVHYVGPYPWPQAAIVVRVIDPFTGMVMLQVQSPVVNGSVLVQSDFQPLDHIPGTWHYPPRVE